MHAAYFLADIEVDSIVLHAFDSDATVSSFRTAHLEPWVKAELDSITAAALHSQTKVEHHDKGDGLILAVFDQQEPGDVAAEVRIRTTKSVARQAKLPFTTEVARTKSCRIHSTEPRETRKHLFQIAIPHMLTIILSC
jgi:hypothetical protein